MKCMDKKQWCTALSRSKTVGQIKLDGTVNRKYLNRRQPKLELANAKQNVLFQNGKVYPVEFSDGCKYVGSTVDHSKKEWLSI